MPGAKWGRGRQSRHSVNVPGDLLGQSARQSRRADWTIIGVILAGTIAGAALSQVSWILGLCIVLGPMVVVVVLALTGAIVTAKPRQRAREEALAERKADYDAWVASFRHADIPPEVIELINRRRFTPARERYAELTGATEPLAEFVLNCYQVDAAFARIAAPNRLEIPTEVVDLIVAGQRGQAAARYAALKAVPLKAAVAVLDTFPDQQPPVR